MVAPAVTAAGITAAADLISGGLNLGFGKSSAKKAKRAAAAQRAWEEYMSNTAHQREVKDLIEAGLNPVLSTNSGASTPSGAMATTPDMQGNFKLENAINSALNYSIGKQQANAQTKTADAQTTTAEAQANLATAQKLKTIKETGLLEPEVITKIKNMNSATAVNEAEKKLVESKKELTDIQQISEKGGKAGYVGGKAVNALENSNTAKDLKTVFDTIRNILKP